MLLGKKLCLEPVENLFHWPVGIHTMPIVIGARRLGLYLEPRLERVRERAIDNGHDLPSTGGLMMFGVGGIVVGSRRGPDADRPLSRMTGDPGEVDRVGGH
ncbi:hypothetical protein ACIQC8_10720 [Agrococcus sediminis]|uniref:hypothetical protein n=1 Tax=Agrococcus sediminis TaxID=2599924 RepID=UPI0038054BB8